VRKNGQNTERISGHLICAVYLHYDARPQNGIRAPQIHLHVIFMNASWDPIENVWKALDFASILRRAPYIDAVFKSHLNRKLADLGLPVGKELHKLIPERVVSFYSERTKHINRVASEQHIADPAEKAKLGAKTREPKGPALTLAEFSEECRAPLSPEELKRIDSITPRAGRICTSIPDYRVRRQLDQIIRHEFERASVVKEDKLVVSLLARNPGRLLPQEAVSAVKAHPELIFRDDRGTSYCTTKTALNQERRLIDLVKNGRGKWRPLNVYRDGTENPSLSKSQQQSLKHCLHSRDWVTAVAGDAGVGKTTFMVECAGGIENRGHRVSVFAPTAQASRGTLREEGFPRAETVAKFLFDKELQEKARGSVALVDEAALLGVPTLLDFLEVAKKNNIRVILIGDTKQHRSVERGDGLRLLMQFAGVKTARITENRRQSGVYKTAVDQLARGHIAAGFRTLDKNGAIQECPIDQGHNAIAQEFIKSLRSKQKLAIISPTHEQGRQLTLTIRDAMRSENLLKRTKTFKQLVSLHWTTAQRQVANNYRRGQYVQFSQNVRGFRAGERVRVAGKDPFGNIAVVGGGLPRSLPLSKAKYFEVYESKRIEISKGDRIRVTRNGRTRDGKREIRNGSTYTVRGFTPTGDIRIGFTKAIGKSFGHIDYGYVTTSPSAQSKTVDNVLLAQSSISFPATSMEQFYTSVSRGRHSVKIYTDDKKGLFEAVQKTSERKSALELVTPSPWEETALARRVRLSIVKAQNIARATRDLFIADKNKEVEREP
jgi:hypothetical protein